MNRSQWIKLGFELIKVILTALASGGVVSSNLFG